VRARRVVVLTTTDVPGFVVMVGVGLGTVVVTSGAVSVCVMVMVGPRPVEVVSTNNGVRVTVNGPSP